MRAGLTPDEWVRLDALMLLASAHHEAIAAITDAVGDLIDLRPGDVGAKVVAAAMVEGRTSADLLALLDIHVVRAY